MSRKLNGFVYFVQAVGCGLIKIGFTDQHPDRRLSSMRCMSPAPLEPLGVLAGGTSLERSMHERFAAIRSHGEWFRQTDELMAYIATEVGPWPEPPPQPGPRPYVRWGKAVPFRRLLKPGETASIESRYLGLSGRASLDRRTGRFVGRVATPGGVVEYQAEKPGQLRAAMAEAVDRIRMVCLDRGENVF